MSIARLLNTGIQDLALELVQEIVFYVGYEIQSPSPLVLTFIYFL